jgi:hypothetical protein
MRMTKHAAPRDSSRRPRVFVSYAREDTDFAYLLRDRLDAETVGDWLLQPGVPDYQRELERLIAAADHLLFIITPESIASSACRAEIDYAASLGKSVLPVVRKRGWRDVDLPNAVRKPQWTQMTADSDDEVALRSLAQTVRTDFPFLEVHTEISQRGAEWQSRRRARRLLLRGETLRVARKWLADAGVDPERLPRPTEAQREYIVASARAQNRRRAAAVVAVLAIVGSWVWTRTDKYQVNQAITRAEPLIKRADYVSIANWSRVLTLTGRAREAVSAIQQTEIAYQQNALRDIAALLEELGLKEDAVRTLQELPSARSIRAGVKPRAFVRLKAVHPWDLAELRSATTLAREGKLSEALDVSWRVSDATYRNRVLVDVVAATLTTPGHNITTVVAAAAERAEHVDTDVSLGADPFAEALAALIEASAKQGDTELDPQLSKQLEQLEADVRTTTDARRHALAMARLGIAFTRVNLTAEADKRLATALAAAESIRDPDLAPRRFQALSRVAEAFAWRGEFDRAIEIADGIGDQALHSHTLARLAELLARAALFRRARMLAESCAVPDDQLGAFAALVLEYARRYEALVAVADQRQMLQPWDYRMFTNQELFGRLDLD